MGKATKIEYCEHTFSPWWGCSKRSEGCYNCYAERWAKRLGRECFESNPRRMLSEATWREPLTWNRLGQQRGRRAFVLCGSMCDVFELGRYPSSRRMDEAREELWMLIGRTPWLFWLLITKRPRQAWKLPVSWLVDGCPDNVGLCVTVESERHLGRVEEMMSVPARLYAVSHEPALGSLGLDMALYTRRDAKRRVGWIITGGETGPGARPMDPEWARQDRELAELDGVPFFFKQWGTAAGGGADPADRAGGNVLDGEVYMERPDVGVPDD